MALRLQRLDAERRRKRLEVIAERSGTPRERLDPHAVRLRELIASRRRQTSQGELGVLWVR